MLDNPLSGINTLLTKLRSLQAHDCIEELLVMIVIILVILLIMPCFNELSDNYARCTDWYT